MYSVSGFGFLWVLGLGFTPAFAFWDYTGLCRTEGLGLGDYIGFWASGLGLYRVYALGFI